MCENQKPYRFLATYIVKHHDYQIKLSFNVKTETWSYHYS